MRCGKSVPRTQTPNSCGISDCGEDFCVSFNLNGGNSANEMSTSLVRKSLEIIDSDNDVKRGKKNKVSKSKGILDLIPTNHRVNTKQSKKHSKIVINNSNKLTIQEAKRRLNAKTDQTDKNIERLLLLSGNKIDPQTADKLLNRALKKRYVPTETTQSVPETTAFTEEDFKRFEKEYHIE